jgi:hypothetical protein
VAVVFAMLLQWWQDTVVTAAHIKVVEFVQSGIGTQCWKVLTDEQNPLSGLVLMCISDEDEHKATHAVDAEVGRESCKIEV